MPASEIDFTGGFDPSMDLMSPEIPDDPVYRESVSMWLFDDANRIQFPRFLIEDVIGDRANRLAFYNVSLPGGRSLVEWGQAPALPMLDETGRPTIYGAGGVSFRCLEPFRRWVVRMKAEVFDTRTEDLIYGAPTGPRVPIELEIETTSAVPPWIYGRHNAYAAKLMEEDTPEAWWTGRGFRYEQLILANGWCKLDGTHYDFKGRGLRVHRRSMRKGQGFRGHVWQTAVFPSGKAFGYESFPPYPDGTPSFCEGYFFDGERMLTADPVPATVPWMVKADDQPQEVGFTLRTAELGDVRIQATSGPTNFSTVRPAMASPTVADPLLQQQGSALYSLNGESAYGMIERSNYRSKIQFARG